MEAYEGGILPVLVIDDVQSARAILCDMLRELGFTHLIEAKDGEEGLQILAKQEVQMIFCDNVMEGMSGIDFLTNLRNHRRGSDVPVIFVSAVGDVSIVEEAIDRGAVDYVVKPISFRKLRRKIDQIRINASAEESQPYEITLER
ncbi:MAG: chemotaxis regulator - transmits chemoreceptor signals to flagelllar motor component CheY [Pseudomonadota bacterium]